jgi:hypothetical protein
MGPIECDYCDTLVPWEGNAWLLPSYSLCNAWPLPSYYCIYHTSEGAIHAPWSHDSWCEAMASQSDLCIHHPLANNVPIDVLVPLAMDSQSVLCHLWYTTMTFDVSGQTGWSFHCCFTWPLYAGWHSTAYHMNWAMCMWHLLSAGHCHLIWDVIVHHI